MNTRGIPTAAYQLLHVLSCSRRVPRVPPLSWPGWGYSGCPPGWDTLHPDLAGGLHPILTWPEVTRVPTRSGAPWSGWTWLGYPLAGSGLENPPGWIWFGYPPAGPGLGTPPPRRCGQTENITFPHPSDAVGNKHCGIPFYFNTISEILLLMTKKTVTEATPISRVINHLIII